MWQVVKGEAGVKEARHSFTNLTYVHINYSVFVAHVKKTKRIILIYTRSNILGMEERNVTTQDSMICNNRVNVCVCVCVYVCVFTLLLHIIETCVETFRSYIPRMLDLVYIKIILFSSFHEFMTKVVLHFF